MYYTPTQAILVYLLVLFFTNQLSLLHWQPELGSLCLRKVAERLGTKKEGRNKRFCNPLVLFPLSLPQSSSPLKLLRLLIPAVIFKSASKNCQQGG
jgi:hypothetical protein